MGRLLATGISAAAIFGSGPALEVQAFAEDAPTPQQQLYDDCRSVALNNSLDTTRSFVEINVTNSNGETADISLTTQADGELATPSGLACPGSGSLSENFKVRFGSFSRTIPDILTEITYGDDQQSGGTVSADATGSSNLAGYCQAATKIGKESLVFSLVEKYGYRQTEHPAANRTLTIPLGSVACGKSGVGTVLSLYGPI